MNIETYKYVNEIVKRIKNRFDQEDVAQEVLCLLIEKDLLDIELDNGLKNYIKGIIWNISTHYYNHYNDAQCKDVEPIKHFIPYNEDDELNIEAEKKYKLLLSALKYYILNSYKKKNKSYTIFKVWYLRHKNYSYEYIMKKLGLGYKTCIESNYLGKKKVLELFKDIKD